MNRTEEIRKEIPTKRVVRRLFEGFSHAFFNYTEHFILYYLYKREQIRQNFTMKDLMEVALNYEKCSLGNLNEKF